MSIYEQGPDGKWGMRLLPVREVFTKIYISYCPNYD